MATQLSRRGFLIGASTTATVGAALVLPGQAGAAPTRTVTQQVAVKWRYDEASRLTTVTRFKARKVVARISGNKVLVRNRAGDWARVPYRWAAKRQALVYDRALHLRLLATGGVTVPKGGSTTPAGSSATAPTQSPPATAPAPSPKSTAPVGNTPSPSAPKPAAPSPTPSPPSPTATSAPVPTAPPQYRSVSSYVPVDEARHVLRRAGFGPTAADLADVQAAGVAAWIDQQLQPDSVPDTACQAVLSRLPDQNEPIWKVRDLINTGRRSGWEQQMSVLAGFSTRALWSKRQLLTVMEDLWGNHFNVTCPGDDIAESRAHYAHTIRRHAFGRFSDLLTAVSKHPSMLTYLNNRDSDDEHPNENQGRELLELHTVGLEAGYTEAMVLDSARILTGLSVDWESGEFEFKPWRHWVGQVSVLGFSHPNGSEDGGEAVADAYFDYLAHHPSTATRIATKLARRFVADEPPPGLVSDLAATYLANDTRIAPVLRQLFASTDFATSIGARTWRPFEHLIAVARLLGLKPDSEGVEGPMGLVWLADEAGHNPFGAPFPTGWADLSAAWLSTSSLLQRWNGTLNIAAGWWPTAFDRPTLRDALIGATLPANHGALIDTLGRSLFGIPLADSHRAAALAFLNKAAGDAIRADSGAVTWRLPELVTLLLDSPYQTVR